MSQEDDVDVTPLSHNPFSYPQERIEHKRSYLWAEKPMRSLNSDWFLQKIGQIWVESNNCTLKQSQFRSLVVKAASVVAPKYTSIKPMGDRILVKIKEAEEKTMRGILLPSTGSKIKEAEEKTMGGILLPSTGQSKPQGGEVVDVGERGIIGKNKVDITVPVNWSTNHLLYKYAGTEVEFNDVKHLILKEDDIGLS
ncbi:unnamed protein product [Brassica oleracea var. botrytis]|uniref:Uncharacterized protein n=2 Tax=Brassica TaxID=3705 RepID=A0A3P6DXY1_BRAOL|nr:hypothetical protein HID58_086832 [Brassica napus]CAF1743054.1 unnamed protein product [Brassica napus]VDD30946.1 unnamed protein product [Brassica oleracea]